MRSLIGAAAIERPARAALHKKAMLINKYYKAGAWLAGPPVISQLYQEDNMSRVLALIMALVLFVPAWAEPLSQAATASTDAGLKWIKDYRRKPDLKAFPAVIRALSDHGSFKNAESAGIYVGFVAGVLHSNPSKARSLTAKILPLPFEDQWLIIRAVAYSGVPQWQDLMRELSVRLPDRQLMTERYLTGKLPTLEKVALEPKTRGTRDKVAGFFKGEWLSKSKEAPEREMTFQSNPDLIDVLWGLYFATGNEAPIAQMLVLLPWSKERDTVEKLTVGSMAKFTLAANAARDAELLALLRRMSASQPKDIAPILKEVIETAETVDTARIGKDALAAVEELKRKGPGSKRDIAWWGQIGEVGLSMGCLGLAVASVGTAAIPCVVGGAMSTAGLKYLGSPE